MCVLNYRNSSLGFGFNLSAGDQVCTHAKYFVVESDKQRKRICRLIQSLRWNAELLRLRLRVLFGKDILSTCCRTLARVHTNFDGVQTTSGWKSYRAHVEAKKDGSIACLEWQSRLREVLVSIPAILGNRINPGHVVLPRTGNALRPDLSGYPKHPGDYITETKKKKTTAYN